MDFEGPSVIISKSPCALLDKKAWKPALKISRDDCIGCKLCLKIGCPALVNDGDKVKIDTSLCVWM